MRIGKLEQRENKQKEKYFNLELAIPFFAKSDFYGKIAEQKNDKSPFLEFYRHGYKCGAAWKKETQDGRSYLSCQIETPALPSGSLRFFIWQDEESKGYFASLPDNRNRDSETNSEAEQKEPLF